MGVERAEKKRGERGEGSGERREERGREEASSEERESDWTCGDWCGFLADGACVCVSTRGRELTFVVCPRPCSSTPLGHAFHLLAC